MRKTLYLFICFLFIFTLIGSSQAHSNLHEVVSLDFKAITTSTQLHEALEQKLDFPDYYGKNWDAFIDCMRDKLFADEQIVFLLKNKQEFTQHLPRDARLFQSSIKDLQKEFPHKLKVIFY